MSDYGSSQSHHLGHWSRLLRLPEVVSFGKVKQTIAFDINANRIRELRYGIDRTCEVTEQELRSVDILFTDRIDELKLTDFHIVISHIVALPTLVNDANPARPDPDAQGLGDGRCGIEAGDIVVYESTAYPGVTEEECVPNLERLLGLACCKDFTAGYLAIRNYLHEKRSRLASTGQPWKCRGLGLRIDGDRWCAQDTFH